MQEPTPRLQRQLATAQPWVRRLLERDPESTAWGYGVYYLPSVVEGATSLGELQLKHNDLLEWADGAVGSNTSHKQMPARLLQPLSWPNSIPDPKSLSTLEEHFIERLDAQTRVQRSPPHKGYLGDMTKLHGHDANAEMLEIFHRLRIDFRQVRRDRPAYHAQVPFQATEGLVKGLLDNVFLVVDEHSAWSWWTQRVADMAWMWAVDPDFDDSEVQVTGSGLAEVYKGYVKVRVQQLTNHFFEAREYQPEVSLQTLWEHARQSRHHLFVSLDPRDYQARSADAGMGSALAYRGGS